MRDPSFVVITDVDPKVPVFHRLGEVRKPPWRGSNRRSPDVQRYTQCGHPWGSPFTARLKTVHARMFARPCKRCFPGDK